MWNEKNINIFLVVFFALLVLGFLFHQSPDFPGSALGHSLGIIGGIFMLMTLIYPFRKRILKKKGKQNPITRHIAYGLIGSSLVVIHSAHKVSSLIGILIFLSVVLVVLSGIAGYYLFKRVNISLKEHKRDQELLKTRIKSRKQELFAACTLENTADISNSEPSLWTSSSGVRDECERWLEEVRAIAEKEYAMKFFDRLKALFTKWLNIHHAFAGLLFALMIVHVLTTIYYGLRWLP